MTRHREQIDAVVQRALQKIIGRGINDPRVRGLVSVTKVSVSPDGAEARVWCSVLPADKAGPTIHGLQSASGWIGRQLGDEVRTRRTPKLRFLLDESLKKQAHVINEIDEAVRREDGQTHNDEEVQA